MGVEVLRAPAQRVYHAGVLSPAHLCSLFCLLFSLIVPFFLAYATGGFWLKTATYIEQPLVYYDYKVMFIGQGYQKGEQSNSFDIPVSYYFTTDEGMRESLGTSYRPAVIESRIKDFNFDGKMDQLSVQITMPLSTNEDLRAVSACIFFTYRLQETVKQVMDSLVHVHHESSMPGTSLTIDGDLQLHQRVAAPGYGGVRQPYYLSPLLPSLYESTGSSESSWNMESLFKRYQTRSEITVLDPNFPVWTRDAGEGTSAATRNFVFNVTVRVPPTEVLYQPGFWEVIKFAWMQYLAFFVLVYVPLWTIKRHLFENRVFYTYSARATSMSGSYKHHMH